LKRFLHPVFASPPTKTEGGQLPPVAVSEKRKFTKPIVNIGKVAPRESELSKVAARKKRPFRVQRALCYHYTIGQTAQTLDFSDCFRKAKIFRESFVNGLHAKESLPVAFLAVTIINCNEQHFNRAKSASGRNRA
jgi:hypothetical protein